MVTRIRRGSARAGCLLMLLAAAAVTYFGMNLGKVWWDYYRYEDRMKQEARFAQHRSDAVIRRRLRAFVDSVGMPEGARNLRVRRKNGVIHIESEYYEHVELPGIVREFRFNPQATMTY